MGVAPESFDAAVEYAVRVASLPPTPPIRRDGPSGRFYDVGDQRFPSVTHILQVLSKPALIQWAANQERTLVTDVAADLYGDLAGTPRMSRMAYLTTLQGRLGKQRAHRKTLEKAAEIGSQIHALIEWNLRRSIGQKVGPEPKVIDAAQWGFMAFQDWANSVQFKPLFIEQTVFSLTHGYAGTMDLLAEIDGVVTLVDFKSGKAVYPEAHLQNVAYQVALSEMGHGTPAAGLVLRLPKVETDPAFEPVLVAPVVDLLPTFLAVKAVWGWWYANEEAYRAKRKASGDVA